MARTEPITVLRPFPGSAPTVFHGMAHGVARYEGEPVVAVAAVDRYVAEDALELIDVDYEPLPHVITVEDALRPGAPQLHATVPGNVVVESAVRAGEPDTRLAEAAVTVDGTFRINRVSGAPIETRGVIARWAEDTSTLELWASTQTPHLLRAQLAHCLRMDETDVRVIAPDVGGAFGLKIGIYPEDIIAALLAIDTRRPVKWIEDRMEFFRGAAHAREAVHALTLGADRDGTMLALRDRYLVDLGAYHGPLGPRALDQYHARRALSPPRRRDPPARRADQQGAHGRLPWLRAGRVELRARGARRPAGAPPRAGSRRRPAPKSPASGRAAVQERQRRHVRQRRLRARFRAGARARGIRLVPRAVRRSGDRRGATSASACRATWSSPAIRRPRSSARPARASAPTRA